MRLDWRSGLETAGSAVRKRFGSVEFLSPLSNHLQSAHGLGVLYRMRSRSLAPAYQRTVGWLS
jgi:hypothetical protein